MRHVNALGFWLWIAFSLGNVGVMIVRLLSGYDAWRVYSVQSDEVVHVAKGLTYIGPGGILLGAVQIIAVLGAGAAMSARSRSVRLVAFLVLAGWAGLWLGNLVWLWRLSAEDLFFQPMALAGVGLAFTLMGGVPRLLGRGGPVPVDESLAPGWHIRCGTCGRSKTLASVGGIRIGGNRGAKKATLGWCSGCRGLRMLSIVHESRAPGLAPELAPDLAQDQAGS